MHFLKKRRNRKTPERCMRQDVISDYHKVLKGFRDLSLSAQIIVLTIQTKIDKIKLSQSETSSILEGQQSLEPRTKQDLEVVRDAVYRCRKYIESRGFPLVIYSKKHFMQDVGLIDWVFEVIEKSDEYRPIATHMGLVSVGIIDTGGKNENNLTDNHKRFIKILHDILKELATEAAGLKEDRDSK